MAPGIAVKICGLTRLDDMGAAIDAGARYVGLVFFASSPRNIGYEQAAELSRMVPEGICKVALTVNADDAALTAILNTVPIDMLQLHGSESPDRVRQVRSRFGLPVMKAVGIAGPQDMAKLDSYLGAADQILVDAKPPKGSGLPGGNGVTFDWSLLGARRWPVPWMLAGGLSPDNVQQAMQITGARQLDLSSGVEEAPGLKSPAKIRAFMLAAQGDGLPKGQAQDIPRLRP